MRRFDSEIKKKLRWNLPIWRNEQEKVKGDIPEGKEENYQAIRIAEADLGIRVDMIQQYIK